MIKGYWRPKDKIVEDSIEVAHSKRNVWLDCVNPSKTELEQLSKMTGVDIREFKDRLVNYERPSTLEGEGYSLVVFGAPVIRKRGTGIASVAILVCKDQTLITLRTEEDTGGIERFRKELLEKNPKYFDSLTLTLFNLFQKIIDTYFEHIEVFQESADRIETSVLENPQKRAIEEIFKIRKSLLFFHKALVANREVVLQIEKEHLSKLSKKDVRKFRDLYNDIVQLVDTVDTQRNVLTGIIDIYTTSSSNQMNQVIKKLTVVASYVMIPTLIASIYGMNFHVMPEISWVWGYPFSIGLMLASILIVYLYFRHSKML
ncbi:magnesium/cobalt transporter CorA [Candidatus Woesearchaeota archaeon]|nr:magnesium/cobalt transporter CorA [Candidatus Woesearchaeota archaeon]